MYLCVFDFGYHYHLLYQGFSVEQVIFLDISSCSEPEMRAKQILRESIWSNSDTDTAPFVDCFAIYSIFMFFLIAHRDG